MTIIVRTTIEALVAITTSMSGVLCVEFGVNTLVEVGVIMLVEVGMTILVEVGMVAQRGSLKSLILTGQSGSNVTMKTPLVKVAPCLTQSSI